MECGIRAACFTRGRVRAARERALHALLGLFRARAFSPPYGNTLRLARLRRKNAIAVNVGPDAHGQPERHRGGSAQARLVFRTGHGDGAEEAHAEALDPAAAGTADGAQDVTVGVLAAPAAAEVAEVTRVLADL